MKKDFIVAKVEASTDGSPYIYVTFKDQNGTINQVITKQILLDQM